MKRPILRRLQPIAVTLWVFLSLSTYPAAQSVTTSSITGVVTDPQHAAAPGVSIVALHQPSGTLYETVTERDGRFFIPGMRVGGPYKITASLLGFNEEQRNGIMLSLGVTLDLDISLRVAAVSETVAVVAVTDAVFSSAHTGAATGITRDELAALPTISGRLNDFGRLTPQYGALGSFAGQDPRMNNVTVDGSYFNNSFGLRNAPGDTSGVAPISVEAIDQVQVSVAPFDVRQGNFVGASVNTVTRSGTNRVTGSVYTRFRNESFVGNEAAGQAFNPGTFDTTVTGEWIGAPIVKNKLFLFESFESQQDTRPLTTYTSNPGGAAAGGNTTRVLASDLSALSSFLSSRFNYDTGPFDGISKHTPGKPFLIKSDYNLNDSNKISFRYNQLRSNTDQPLSGSSSLGLGRQTFSTNFLSFAGSNYSILENIRAGVGEWNSVFGRNSTNNLIVGVTHQDESRGDLGTVFPFVDIADGNGVAYTSFGSELFTPFNQLRYNTFQAQDSYTRFSQQHTLTLGASVEKYRSENSFYPGVQSAYVYNTLNDFYTDANDFLANPGRTTSPVSLRRFQVRYSNVPGQTTPPVQPLDVWYSSFYGQDQWRPRNNFTVTAGLRVDVAKFGDTAFDNAAVDSLTFRDQYGAAVKYDTGALPKATPLWSPRVGFNWDVTAAQTTQVRGGSGIFTGKPAYVWISNQIGNSGMLTGFVQADNTTAFPFNPNPDHYKPAPLGTPPASVDLAVTDPNFKFPQTWRNNIAVDRKLPLGLTGTIEYMYSRDVNGMAYINANLPAAQSTFAGPDERPRWVGPSCTTPTAGPCVNRINNAPGNQVIENIVLQNQGVGRSWNLAGTLSRNLWKGLAVRGAYSYGEARNTVDPGSIAAGSWTNNPIVTDPNNPPLALSSTSPGHRVFVSASYTRQYFGFGGTTVAAFFDAHPTVNSINSAYVTNVSYVYAGDMNGDGATSNDLIYIPRNTSEMNFQTFTTGGKTFTAAAQATAFEAYIQQDDYLRNHRGSYAERDAVFFPMVKRIDVALTQDLFHRLGGNRHSGQIRLDITNFGNLLSQNWGVGQNIIQNKILAPAGVDGTGRPLFRLATVATSSGPALISKTFQSTALSSATTGSDVYILMLSFRYTFN